MLYDVSRDFIIKTIGEIFSIDSPSGYCKDVIKKIEELVSEIGYKTELNRKGNCIIEVDGKDNSYCVGLCAHVDTLGAMVRSINSDGTLRFTSIGGNILNTLDGEYCKIYSRSGKVFTGTILSTSPAIHVFKDARDKERSEENMCVRLDEKVRKKEDTEKLGIMAGDFIAVDPKTQITKNDFVKSRYIDDKGGTTCVLSLLELLKRENIKPNYKLKIIISTYEEVGHGSSNIPQDIDELIAVDMGCIGDDLSCTEYDVSICPKDSSGPYDYDITTKLIQLAKKYNLNYAVDIYPQYGSDVSAALRAGNNIKGGLIGPGVHASHGMERTHYEGLENTIKLLTAYVTE